MRTYNVKLLFQLQQDKQLLLDFLSLSKDIWNHLSKHIFNTQNLNKKILHDKTYKKTKKAFPCCQAQQIIRAQHDVTAAYKAARSNGIKWTDMEQPFEKKKLSIRLDKRLYSNLTTESISLSTLNKNHKIKATWRLYPLIEQHFKQYKTCDPLLFVRDNDIFLSISFETPDIVAIPKTILGIDVGERRFLTTSEGNYVSGKELVRYKRAARYQRKLLRQHLYSHSARKKKKRSSEREQRFSDNYVHHVVNTLLSKVKSNTVIVLEELDGLKQKRSSQYRNRKKNQYPWKKLRDFLTYKALPMMVSVATVNPAYTSQDDYRGIERGVRKGCRYIASDGMVFDADWNAAINIANKYNEDYVKHPVETLPVSFKEPLDGMLNLMGRLCQEPIVN